jgi:oligoribonuclease NrnB/cAMP/cGMP phosphodiesterase (DHH superfamily)
MIRVYYHDDFDGECAASAVNLLIDGNKEFIAMNHGFSFPFSKIKKNDEVWILDYCVTPEMMDKIIAKVGINNVIWIDHHVPKFTYNHQIHGFRDTSESACVWTWKYILLAKAKADAYQPLTFTDSFDWDFTPEVKTMLSTIAVPRFVELIGDRDTFHWLYGEETKYFFCGLIAEDTKPDRPVWQNLYNYYRRNSPVIMNNISDRGAVVYDMMLYENARNVNAWAYEAEFEGYKCIVLNGACGSEAFGLKFHDYPIAVGYIHDGKNFQITLYASMTNEIDVSKIAIKYGGGGHPKAAGFSSKKLPFKNIKRIKM